MTAKLRKLTQEWGPYKAVTLYLNRCQVDTPDHVVTAVWRLVSERRSRIGKVVDFGAGDARFALGGSYKRYIGYEIDAERSIARVVGHKAALIHRCAFSTRITDADVCLGNPPYVRNQDLPEGWRARAAHVIERRTGVKVSGLANAWQYFALLALASTKDTGLVALVIPYEWVSRPSSRAFREFLRANKWDVSAYRLRDETFHRVLTTSSIALIDKRQRSAEWRYFEEKPNGEFRELPSATPSPHGVIPYSRSRSEQAYARRGLSPGTQQALVLTEGERAHHGLRIGADVVRCVTSLRNLPSNLSTLTPHAFDKHFRNDGMKCWLIRTDREPSSRLKGYLTSVPTAQRKTRTCKDRVEWWRFAMPAIPSVLVASGFVSKRPKSVINNAGAIAVGAVYGIYALKQKSSLRVVKAIRSSNFMSNIVAHSNGLRKLEVGQLETFLAKTLKEER